MNVRVTALLVATSAVFGSAAPASAASMTVNNATTFTAHARSHLLGCKGDVATIAPGGTFTVNQYA